MCNLFYLLNMINAQWSDPDIVSIQCNSGSYPGCLESVNQSFSNSGILTATINKNTGSMSFLTRDTTLEWHESLQFTDVFLQNILSKFNKLFLTGVKLIGTEYKGVFSYFNNNSWSTPVVLFPSLNGDIGNIEFVAGNPAVIFRGSCFGCSPKVYYKRALDPLGSVWPQDSIVLGNWTDVQFVLLDNYPTIFGRKGGGLWMKRSNDLLGDVWNTEIEVLPIYPNKFDVKIVSGFPAVTLIATEPFPFDKHLVYRRSLDPIGNNWSSIDTLLSTNANGVLYGLIGMEIVNGKPIIALRGDDGGDNIYIMESLDEYGNNWDTPYLIVDETGLSTPIFLNVIDNIPHVIYKNYGTTYITYGNGGPPSSSTYSDWIGTLNSDWDNEANWSDGTLPSDSMNILIDGGVYSHVPVISNIASVKRILLVNGGKLIVNDTLNISQEIILDSESKIENNSIMKGLNISSAVSMNSLDTLQNNKSLIDLNIISLGTVINNDTLKCDSLHFLQIYPGGKFINNGYTNIISKIDCFGEIINENKIFTPKLNNINGVLKLNQDSLLLKQN